MRIMTDLEDRARHFSEKHGVNPAAALQGLVQSQTVASFDANSSDRSHVRFSASSESNTSRQNGMSTGPGIVLRKLPSPRQQQANTPTGP